VPPEREGRFQAVAEFVEVLGVPRFKRTPSAR
jgi:hypothetical protein